MRHENTAAEIAALDIQPTQTVTLPRDKRLFPKASRKAVAAWCLYDWANSAFALTVMAVFFPAFFKGYWSHGVDTAISTVRLGMGSALAGLIVAAMSPLLGTIAAAGRSKKRFLIYFVVLGVIATALFYFIPKGAWLIAISVYIFARIGFSLANLFYDALIVDVSDAKNRDMVSAIGYGVGYLGCGILFVFNIIMFTNPALFGLASGKAAVQVSFLVVALWWFLFTIPLMIFVKSRSKPHDFTALKAIVQSGLRQLSTTAKEILRRKEMMLFLLAYWFYIDGMHTIVIMGADFGLSIGLPLKAMMTALLLVQFVAFPAAIAAGYLAGKIGAKNTILIAIAVYAIVALVGAWVMEDSFDFTLFACLTGMVQGAIQALSRSLFTTMIPPGKETELFGFYNMVGRFAVVLGPAIVGGCNLMLHLIGVDSQIAARFGFSILSILFIVGGSLLLKTPPIKTLQFQPNRA